MTELLDEVRAQLAGWLADSCEPDEHLFSTGRLSSATLMQLIGWLEQRYRIEVGPADVSLANFDTARRVSAYLTGRLGVVR